MRKIILSTLLGVGTLGFIAPNDAKASWLSEAFGHSRIDVHVGPQYPAYPPAPVYAPPPAYPVYRPAPVYPPAYSYYPPQPQQTYQPAPSCAPPAAHQPAPSYYYQPRQAYYGPYRYDPYQRDGRDPRYDHDWRR